ncbi:pyrroloquinoline quinone biosynthesis peptide chaperone PqqD, partial [Actinomadura adrarensis]
ASPLRTVSPMGSVRTPVDSADRPRLAPHVRLTYDQVRERHVLLTPEAVTVLNATGATILGLCDGERMIADIVAELRGRYEVVIDDEVRDFLSRLVEKRCVEVVHD